MPRRKKKPHELTTEEAVKRLFPKKVIEEVKRQVGSDAKSSIKPKDTA